MPNRKKTRKVKTPWRQRCYTLRRKQRGGRFVGSGTYGCGFRPALRCEGEAARRRGKFAKLVHQSTAREEMMLRDIVVPLDPARNYFLYPEAICEPAPFEASDEVAKCHLKFSAKNPQRVIIMGKGGENLENLTLRPREYVPFFESLRNVFSGLMILNTAGLAHMDAKPPNIVTRRHSDGSFHTRLIDFGLMIDPTRLDMWSDISGNTFDSYTVLNSNYLYWPFEVRLLKPSIMAHAVAQSFEIVPELARFYRELASVRRSVPYELFGARRLTRAEVTALVTPLAGMEAASRYAAIINKVDVHGLGVTLAQIYYRFTGHRDAGGVAGPVIAVKAAPPVPNPVDPTKPAIQVVPTPVAALAPSAVLPAEVVAWHQALAERLSIPFYTLVRAMTEPLPARRPTMEVALAAYDAILLRLAEELTAENVSMAVKPWMLDAGVLVEGATPVAGAAMGGAGAAAAGASSSSEVPPSPAAGGAGRSPRRAAVMPALAAAGRSSEGNMVSYVSNSNASVGPNLFREGDRRVLSVSSSSASRRSAKTNTTNSYNSSEERRFQEAYINRMLNGANENW